MRDAGSLEVQGHVMGLLQSEPGLGDLLPAVWTSASFLAELSVSSPQKSFIFII